MGQFEALPGYFQAYATDNSTGVDAAGNKHLEFVVHGSWKDLFASIPNDTDDFVYKFLVLARHGQGHHNVGVELYGEPEWDRYWSKLDGDEHRHWLDAHLTPLGIEQARDTGALILSPMCKELGLPDVFYCSPMRRCIETFIGSWSQILEGDGPVPVHIVENLRETLGEHTCDKRVNQKGVLENYQGASINTRTLQLLYDQGYPDQDQLWKQDHRETDTEMDERIHLGLSRALSGSERFVSITCHSGVIQSALRVLAHPPVGHLNTGGIVCCVVRCKVADRK
ncbi:LAFE_0C09846g1_1 [Lachancea fermentati]|uniref:LAFE_0C09846g1_1 n=1 Tax=Lachancea fermentati TaxID=4955 RepID=A0A1G4M9Z6_LACFM|nr:LAFE_0C09846g1_1 [Lachancea fermentati]